MQVEFETKTKTIGVHCKQEILLILLMEKIEISEHNLVIWSSSSPALHAIRRIIAIINAIFLKWTYWIWFRVEALIDDLKFLKVLMLICE